MNNLANRCGSKLLAEYYREGKEFKILPALAPVAATRTGLKRMSVMNDDEQID